MGAEKPQEMLVYETVLETDSGPEMHIFRQKPLRPLGKSTKIGSILPLKLSKAGLLQSGRLLRGREAFSHMVTYSPMMRKRIGLLTQFQALKSLFPTSAE